MNSINAAMKKFEENLKFRISRVTLKNNAQQEYMHTTKKLMILLDQTKADPLMQGKQGEVVQPMPPMSLRDCKELQQSQRFDITALVGSVDSPKKVSDTRQVIPVKLIDASGESGNTQELTLSYFMDVPVRGHDTATTNILQEVAGKDQALTLFAIRGQKAEKGYVLQTCQDFFVVQAIGARAQALATVAATLHDTPTESRDILEQYQGEQRDYESEQGVEMVCKLLSDLTIPSEVAPLNASTTLWQVNWVEVAWPPPGVELLTKKGDRLWFQTCIRDATGQVPYIWMNEKSALTLAQLKTKEQFMSEHAAGKQLFPAVAAVKVLRSVPDTLSLDSDDAHVSDAGRVNMTIVHANDQPLDESPTRATLNLLPLLRNIKDDTASLMPAGLHMVNTSTQYAFVVNCKSASGVVMSIPCQKVLALIKSNQNSNLLPVGTGFKLITEDVEDLLAECEPSGDAHPAPQKHTLSAICTLDNLRSFKLDPPRGGTQHALVTITAKTPDAFVVETVQPLTQTQAEQAASSLKQLLYLAMHMHNRDRKRVAEWSNISSPATHSRCKRLGRSPTDAEVPKP